MTLPDLLEAALLEHGPMAECHLATAVRKRKDDVSAVLEAHPERFTHNGGKARASRWALASSVRTFDADALLELHPGWSSEDADEILRWLIDAGFAASANGSGAAYATERGLGPLTCSEPL